MNRIERILLSFLLVLFIIANVLVLQPNPIATITKYDSNNSLAKEETLGEKEVLTIDQSEMEELEHRDMLEDPSQETDNAIVEERRPKDKEILIKYKNEKKADSVMALAKKNLKLDEIKPKRKFSKLKLDVISLGENDDINKTIQELRKNPNVEYVQPNYKLRVNSIPADPQYTEQWYLENNAQEVFGQTGRQGVDVDATAAWNLTTGSNSVIVGILDTGIDINHVELRNNIYVNTGETAGNGIDDDNNGYIDDINGWDFANDDGTIYDSETDDNHGTLVAGIIAAQSNTEGISGIAPNIKVIPLKFISNGYGYTDDIIEAIEYASNTGIQIINCSFGGTDNNLALKDAMQNCGIYFVCAAGNRGEDISSSPVYPAAFNLPNIMSVTAIDSKGILAPFSSYGDNVDVAAPGVNIKSTSPNNSYDYLNGTSASASITTGIAALVKSQFPDLTYMQIADQIKNNVTECTSLQGKVAAGGRVNAYGALTGNRPQLDTYDGPGVDSVTISPGELGTGSDSWYTADQLGRIREMNHYGQSGVNSSTGNFSFTCIDMSVDSPGFEINTSRTYNAKNNLSKSMGKGWTFGFEGKIEGTDFVTATLPDGSVQTFKRNSNGAYTAEDSRSMLEKKSDGTFVLTTKDQYQYGYSNYRWLSWMKDRNGNQVTITTENTSGKVQKIADAVGREYIINYTNGLISSIVDPALRNVIYGYNTSGYLDTVTDSTGSIMRYHYNTNGLIDEIRDHNSNLIQSFEYYTTDINFGKVKKITDNLGSISEYTYDNTNRMTFIKENGIRNWTYWYDSYFYTTKYQDPEGRFTETAYYLPDGVNKFGDINYTVDRNGNKTSYFIDDRGNVTRILNPDNSTREYSYDIKNNTTMEKDEADNKTYYIYDNYVNLKYKVQLINKGDIFIPDTFSYGNYDKTRLAVAEYTYYSNSEAQALFGCNIGGLLKSEIDPNTHTTTYTYDNYGYIETIKDDEDKVTRYDYNNIGWKISEESPKGYIDKYYYDNNGLLEKEVLNYNPTVISDETNQTTRYDYDIVGRKVKEVSSNDYELSKDDLTNHTYNGTGGYSYEYFDSGMLKSVKDAEGYLTSYTYDTYGNKLTETRANDSVFVYDYDEMNRVKKAYFKENVTATPVLLEEDIHSILSDGRTQKTEIIYLNDSEKATSKYIYDYAERLIEQQNPDNTIEKKAYNPDGSIKSETDPRGYTTYYSYDGLKRLTEAWKPAEDNNGIALYSYSKFEYDNAGNKVAEKFSRDKVTYPTVPSSVTTTTYTYYNNNLLKSVIDNEGRKKEYLYDDNGNVSQESIFTTITDKLITEYQNNHLGKVLTKNVHMKQGDIEGYDYNNNTESSLITTYTYDKNGNLKSVKTPDNITTTYTYDKMNRQIGTSQPGKDEYGINVDITASITYDWKGNLLTETDGKGYTTRYEYSKRGLLTKSINVKNGTTAYYYDRAGRKIGEVSPRYYDSTKSLNQMNRIEFIYDSMDRIIAEKDVYKDEATGQWVTVFTNSYSYDANGNITKELDALGYEAGTVATLNERINSGYGKRYVYSPTNMVLTILDPVSEERGLPYSVKYQYDALGRKVSETNANGNISLFSYDDSDNLLIVSIKKSENSPIQILKSMTYDLANRMTTTTDGNGNTTELAYNAFGKVRKMTVPRDNTIPQNITCYQYDSMGNLKKSWDSTGKYVMSTYDNQGRQLTNTVQESSGSNAITLSVKYDKNGNKKFETNGNNKTKEYFYDELDRLVKDFMYVRGFYKSNLYTYDPNGNQLTATDWRGNVFENIYDPLNRLIQKKDPYATIQKLVYNKNNIQIESFDALDNKTEFKYDKNNRLLETIDAKGHVAKQSYDNVGNIKSKTDGRNFETEYFYDELNRLKSVENANSETTGYSYDLNGNLLMQVDGSGKATIYEYNVMNKPIKKIDHGGRTGTTGSYQYNNSKVETYTYYADGALHTKKDRNGNETTYSYDVHGRMISQVTGSIEITYQYDKNGNILKMTDDTGETIRTYDEQNRTLTKTVPGIGKSIFQYDIMEANGCIAEIIKDPKGNSTKKIYDKAGRLKSVTNEGNTTTYDYYDNGNRRSVTYPNGSVEEYGYDADNLNTSLINKTADGTIIETYGYTYDSAHNQNTKTDAKGTTSYSYDNLNRLEKAIDPDGTITSYLYDKSGNRLTEAVIKAGITTTTTYDYNSQNRLLSTVAVTGSTTVKTTYIYDNNGNTLYSGKAITKPVVSGIEGRSSILISGQDEGEYATFYTYDELNRMASSTTGSKKVSYKYNGAGLRVEKNTNGTITQYLYDGDKIILELDGTGNQIALNVQGINTISRTVNEETAYYMYNGHGDVTELLSATGNVLVTYYYDAFGNLLETTGESDNPFRYAGYQYDEETGVYYLNARYYDPKIARFLTEDTYRGSATDPLSLNLYTYCHNEPVMYTDPTGHWEQGDKKKSAAAQAQILKATKDYSNAASKGDKVGMATAHQKAEDARAGKIYNDKSVSKQDLAKQIEEVSKSKYVSNGAKKDLGKSAVSSATKSVRTTNEREHQKSIIDDINKTRKNSHLVEPRSVGTIGLGNTAKTVSAPKGTIGTGYTISQRNAETKTPSIGEQLKMINTSTAMVPAMMLGIASGGGDANKTAATLTTAVTAAAKLGAAKEAVVEKATSLIKNVPALVKEAGKMGNNEAVQKEANNLVKEFLKGNTNPGIGSKNLVEDINYLRGRNGARVFFRIVEDTMEILGKSSKANEQKVIDIIKDIYR